MPRPERQIDPADGPVARFAVELRELRRCVGGPGYRELARRAHYSATTLAQAARGMSLPSLAVTLAFVRACGGDVAEWEGRWRATSAELDPQPLPTPGDQNAVGGRAPYVGLAAYRSEDAEWFCGRDRVVAGLVERVTRQRFVAVVGASGAGKTSVLRAGLLPALSADEGRWSTLMITPGAHPLEESAVRLGRRLGMTSGQLIAEFTENSRNFGLAVRQLMSTCPDNAELLLVVDQLEEIFTLCHDADERDQFIAALLDAVHDTDSRARIVVGLRADFYTHCAQHARLVEALEDAQVLVGPMSTDELTEAITQPAARADLMVEKTLVATVVHDAAERPGALPFVSHALWETWKRRHGNGLFLAGYQATGGVAGAIAQTADRVYNDFDAQHQRIARALLLRLTALGEGTEDTRRRVSRTELLNSPDRDVVTTVLDKLAAARLVTLDTDTVEIAHEALIRGWPALREWLTEDRETLRAHRQLTEAAVEWERHEHDESLLYRGVRLTAWQDRLLDRFNDVECAFLAASHRAAEREHRLRRRRIRVTIGGLTTAIAIITVLAVIAFVTATRAGNERDLAVSRQLIAEARGQLQLDPELALLLAREAYTAVPTEETEAVLRQAVADSHIRFTLPKSESPLSGVAFSSDGKHLVATSGWEGAIMWDWDAERRGWTMSRRLREDDATANGGIDPVDSPAFSPDNRRVAVINLDGVVSVWDWAGRAEPVKLGEPYSGGCCNASVVFSPDGQHLASSGADGVIKIWNLDTPDQPRLLLGHDGSVSDITFSPDGERLASSGDDSTVRIWDLVEGGDRVVLRGFEGGVTAVAFSPDGRHLAMTGGDNTVRVWDADGDSAPDVIGSHDNAISAVAYSNDGRWIASAGTDNTVRVWNAHHRTASTVLRGHHGVVTDVMFSPDGKSLASVSNDGTAKIWDVDTVDYVTVLRGHHGTVSSVTSSPDGRRVASGGQDGTVRIWDIAGKHAPIVLREDDQPVTQVTFSRDGRYLATIDQAGTVLIWDIRDLTKPAQQPVDSSKDAVAFSPDGKRLVLLGHNSLAIWDAAGRRMIEQLTGLHTPTPSFGSRKVAWSPDGRHLAASSEENVVRLWDLRTGADPSVLPGNPGLSLTLAFSRDGTRLASGSVDGTITLWDVTTNPTQPVMLHGHQGDVWDVSFNADGRHLITSGNDGTVRIWNTDGTGEPLVLDEFRAPAHAVVPMTNGRYLTAHEDGTIRIWRCPACRPITEVLATADHHVTRSLTPDERRTYLPANP